MTAEHDGRPRLELVPPVPAGAEPQQLDQDHGADAGQAPAVDPEPVGVDPAREVDPRPSASRAVAARVPGGVPAGAVRPVLPVWMRYPATFRAAAVWAGRRAAHLAGFHAVRLPLYGLRLVGRAPVGLGRLVGWWSGWVSDATGRVVRENLASGPGITPDAFYRVTEQHRQQVRGRLVASAAGMVLLVAVALGVLSAAPDWAVGMVLLGLVGLGVVGRSPDARIVARSVDTDSVPRLTSDLILTALASVGIAELNKAVRVDATTAVRFPSPITRDGPGFRADIDLPPGVTAGDVIERRDRLASGLRRPQGCV